MMQRAHMKAEDKNVLEFQNLNFLQFWMHFVGFPFTKQLTKDGKSHNFILHEIFSCGSVIKID